MNYRQFVAGFRNPERVAEQEGRVVVAGTVLMVTKERCHLDINGAQYEIAADDVIDIEAITPAESPKAEPPQGEAPPKKESGETQTSPVQQDPVVVLITLSSNAVLCQRIPAALIAATGIWMNVVPAAVASA